MSRSGKLNPLERYRLWYGRTSDRFRLGSHYTIDRFGIKVGVLAVIGALILVGASCSAFQAGKAELGAQALYTSKFTTSRTATTGAVDKVYRSNDGHRALVTMTFDDPTRMSTQASDYYVYAVGLDGSDAKSVSYPLTGQIYVFGSTGTMAVLLEAPEGFDQQLINLTVRAKKELSPPRADLQQQDFTPSFREHDQWRVILNPAASGASPLRALDSEKTPDARSVYADAVLWPTEADQRRKLDGLLAQMKAQHDRMDALGDQMASTSVTLGADRDVKLLPPSLPEVIDGDTFSGMSATELGVKLSQTPADQVEGIGDKTRRARMMDTYDDGSLPNTYVLHSRKTFPGGTDFDWRSRTVSDGYFESMGTGYPTVEEYLSALQNAAAGQQASLSARDLRWPLSNGKTINDIKPTDTGATPLIDLRNRAIAAYNQYYALKQQYQTYELVQLLVYESRLDGVADSATVAGGSGTVDVRS